MVAGKLYVANAGGAFPGGMFGIGVLEKLAEEIEIAKVTGESSGAINALLVAYGETATGVELWREVLGNAPNVLIGAPFKNGNGIGRFFHDLAENPTFFTIQKPVFEAIEKHTSLERFVESEVHTRIIYNKINNFFVTDAEKTYFHEHLMHVLSFLFPLNSKRGILDNRTSDGVTYAEFKKKVQASCNLPPFYPRATKFGGEGIINDGCLIDELGGVDLLIQDALADENARVLVITRYSPESKKHQRRTHKLRELCQIYGLPTERVSLVSPESKLPISSNYTNNLDELDECYHIGKLVAEQTLKRL